MRLLQILNMLLFTVETNCGEELNYAEPTWHTPAQNEQNKQCSYNKPSSVHNVSGRAERNTLFYESTSVERNKRPSSPLVLLWLFATLLS